MEIDVLPTGKKVGNALDETLKIGGGATTAGTPTVTIPRDAASTNTVLPLLRLQRTSSGTPANGIGASLDFEVETSAGNNEIVASIEASVRDVTAASEDADLIIKLMTAGATAAEVLRVRNALFGTSTLLMTNGVDTMQVGPLGNYSSTVTAQYGLQLKAGDGSSIDLSGPGTATAPINGDPNGSSLSRFGWWFGRHAGMTQISPYTCADTFIKFTPHTSDEITAAFAITGQGCFPTAVTNITGGALKLTGGAGPTGANGSGGAVNLCGGLGYGTGFTSNVNLAYTGSAAQGGIVTWGLIATSAAAPTIASAATIAPTTQIAFVSGVAAIDTITPPRPISLGGGTITIIPTGVFTWTAAGNIAIAGTAVVNKALTMTYDVTTTKWYPSYLA